MNLPEFITPPSIYHGCSIRKTFWEEKFTGKEFFFLAVNMKCFGCRNVRKYKEIKGSDKYVTLDISSKFVSLDKMKITSSESKVKFGKIRKGIDLLWVYRPKQGRTNTKRKGMPSEMSVRRTFLRLLGSLRNLRNYLVRKRGPSMSLLTDTFI